MPETKEVSKEDFLKVHFALNRFIQNYKDWDKFSIAATKLKRKFEPLAKKLFLAQDVVNRKYCLKEKDVPVLLPDVQGRNSYQYKEEEMLVRDNAMTDLMNEPISLPIHIVKSANATKQQMAMFNLEERLLLEGIIIEEGSADNEANSEMKVA